MCLSKNVNDERDAPYQILIGSMDATYCVLLGLAIHLETWIESGKANNAYVFDLGTNNPENAKSKVARILKNDVWGKAEFHLIDAEPIGTHSLRKYPSTYARNNGCSRDDVDHRGRWKRRQQQVDTYIDVQLPYPDAKVAAALCVGGPCKYGLRQGSQISDNWLSEFVVPHIMQQYSRDVALTLGRALLWAAFEPSLHGYLPAALCNHIHTAYDAIPGKVLLAGENPVEKLLIVVTGYEGELYIDELGASHINANGNNQNIVVDGQNENNQQQRPLDQRWQGYQRNELLGLYSQLSALRRQIQDLQAQVNSISVYLHRMNNSMNRYARQPAQQLRNTNNQAQAVEEVGVHQVNNASLSRTPRSLYILWQEYEVGIGGQKPAKLFTPSERGKVKVVYCKRKVVWDKISALVRAGYTSDAAIDKIYSVYGQNLCVTDIIKKMKHDHKTGGHQELRI